MSLIIGNIIALIASLLMVYTGIIKEKKKVLYVQSMQIGLFAISNLVLNGISGFIINAINFIRNIICYRNKLNVLMKLIISIVSIGLTLYFNNFGIIGLLPLVSALVYLWFMTIKDDIKFKIILIISVALWLAYDFTIKSYTASVFDILTILTSIISIFRLRTKR